MKRILLLTIFILVFCFQMFGQDCPIVKVNSPSSFGSEGERMVFTVSLIGAIENPNLKFIWMLSKGIISDGQGTSVIEVIATKEMEGQPVIATVKVKGLPKVCKNSASGLANVIARTGDVISFRIDEYEKITWQYEEIRLRKVILAEFKNYPNSRAYLVFSYRINSELNIIKARQKKILKFFKHSGIHQNRFQLVIGKKEIYQTSIWLIPEGASIPN